VSRPPLVLGAAIGTFERLRLEPWFSAVRDQVVRPDQVAPTTLYFWRRWAPRLGPEAVLMLLWMRARFSRTRADQERGEFNLPAQEELAAATGLSTRAVRSALGALELRGFIARRRNYRWEPDRRQTVHLPDRYLVALEDPVAPEDEALVLELAAQRIADAHPQERGCVGRIGTHTPEPIHNRGGVGAGTLTTPASEPGGCGGRIRTHTPSRNDLRGVGANSAPSNVKEESTDNVNVEAQRGDEARQRALVDDLVDQLYDPGSRRYYAIVAARMPEECVRAALSEARSARRLGSVRRSAGAYFTDLIKRAALELGVELRRPRGG
jgi:hypothetical protein